MSWACATAVSTRSCHDNYNPASDPEFDAEREVDSLREMVQRVEERSESPELMKALRRQALGRGGDPSAVPAKELDGVLKRNRVRWSRNRLVRAGMRRAKHLGWPNIYTFTKSLGESMLSRARARSADRHRAPLHRGKLHAFSLRRLE